MGALFAKDGCGSCFHRKNRKISPETLDEMDEMSLQERRRSDEIIAELKSCGIITSETAKGGLYFDIMPCGNLPRRPGRLPALQRSNVEPTETTALKNKERLKQAAIRRQETLDKKAKVGKEYDCKRMAVLERRANKIKDKIRRTEEKLNKGRRESTK